MKIRLTKRFGFSASHEKDGKHFGHNYTLIVTVEPHPDAGEPEIAARVDRALIHRMESRDLGLSVDLLKGIEISDENLLRKFWSVLERELKPASLESLTLQKDARTEMTLSR